MTAFTVTAIEAEANTWQNDHGEFRTYRLKLEGQDKVAHLNQKAATPAPAVGAVLDLDLTPHPRFADAWKAKKVQAANGFGGGGGGRGRSPEESARIVQQHSQEMALRYAELQHACGKLPDNFTLEQILVIASKFAADAMGAKP